MPAPTEAVIVTTKEILYEKREAIRHIAAKHGAYNIRLFGSAARGEDKSDRDIDLLIDAGAATSSWFPAGFVIELETLLGRGVEVVTEKWLNPDIREQVLREAIPL